MREDNVIWEAQYADGLTLTEPARYTDIDRNRLTKFRLKEQDALLVEIPMGTNGNGLGTRFVYRRRTRLTPGVGRMVEFVMGWIPTGPVFTFSFNDGLQRHIHWKSVGEVELYPEELATVP